MEITVRAARDADAAGMVAVLNPLIRAGDSTAMDTAVTVEEQRAFIRDFPEAGVFLVAVDAAGRLVGMQDVMPAPTGAPVGEISTFVTMDAQRQRVGHRLSAATFEAAIRKGYRVLRAHIRADNASAIAFYERQGFQPVGRLEGHAQVRGRPVDVVVAEKALG